MTALSPNNSQPPGPLPLIEYSNVTVQVGGSPVLDDLSLVIGDGEHVAILGPNGSGKSTLMKTITRQLYPLAQEGSFIRIYGRELFDISDIRPLLGVVANDLIENSGGHFGTIREVVLSGFFGSTGIWPNQTVTPDMQRRADEALDWLDLSHLADRRVDRVSSGEARRALVARALVNGPRAVLLDEPTNSLDFAASYQLRVALSRLARGGTGIILVTHHLQDIIPEVTRVILLSHGRVVADGPKREMLTSQRLSALFGVELEVKERDGSYYLL